MAIRVALQHRTSYRFDRQVMLAPHDVRLRPAPHCRTPVLGYSLRSRRNRTSSTGSRIRMATGSRASSSRSPRRHSRSTVDLVADMTVINPFDFFVEPHAESYPFAYDTGAREGARCLFARQHRSGRGSPRGSMCSAARSSRARTRSTLLVRLNQQLQQRDPLPRPHGAGRADARGDARARMRLVPRLGLAAGADPAAPRARRAVRFGLPDPARRRT